MSFNSLTDSHMRGLWNGLYAYRECFQFPNGFSLKTASMKYCKQYNTNFQFPNGFSKIYYVADYIIRVKIFQFPNGFSPSD